MIFNSVFPSNPVDDKKAEIARERAELRAEGIKQWQLEEMKQQKLND